MLYRKITGTKTVFDLFKMGIDQNSLNNEDLTALQFSDRDVADFLNTEVEYKRIRRSVSDYRR